MRGKEFLETTEHIFSHGLLDQPNLSILYGRSYSFKEILFCSMSMGTNLCLNDLVKYSKE